MYTQQHCIVHQPAWLGTDRQCERLGRARAFARHAAVELSKQQLDRYMLSKLQINLSRSMQSDLV